MPVKTCRPSLIRYRSAGWAGRRNHPVGVLRQVVDQSGHEAHREGDAEQDAKHRAPARYVQRALHLLPQGG